MRVLIVEENKSRGVIWQRFLQNQNTTAVLVHDEEAAITALTENRFGALVVNITIANSSVLAISDLASVFNPEIAIIAVTSGRFFSDGSIFNLIPNARGCVGGDVNPEDLANMVGHYGRKNVETRPLTGPNVQVG